MHHIGEEEHKVIEAAHESHKLVHEGVEKMIEHVKTAEQHAHVRAPRGGGRRKSAAAGENYPPPLLPFPETQARRVHAEEESAKAEEHLKRIGGHIKDGFA